LNEDARVRDRSGLDCEVRIIAEWGYAPAKQMPVGNDTYTLAWVCKTHDCGDNQLHVLFSPQGEQAWGLLMTRKQAKMARQPSRGTQKAILDAKY